MKLIHSADWQIGMRFRQFGAKAEVLRAARLRTLQRALEHAATVFADAFLIAGDLFEDNQVDAAVVRAVFDLFAEFSDVPIFILPGNHDPVDGPGCLWRRAPFAQLPVHVTIFQKASAIEMAGGWLIANPLSQKKSTVDPSLKIAELAATLPADAIKIGLTHGSPAIESQHQPDDFPIALDAATRAGLDYLAIGHWHGALALDGGRLMMPGTPEQTKFDEANAGAVQEVEIAARGVVPKVTPVRVGELMWHSWTFDVGNADAARASLAQSLRAVAAESVVVRVALQGEASPEAVASARAWLETELAPCLIAQIEDHSTLVLTAAELADLQSRHPLVAEVLAELRDLSAGRLSAADLQTLSAQTGVPFEGLTESVAEYAQRVLLRELREVVNAC